MTFFAEQDDEKKEGVTFTFKHNDWLEVRTGVICVYSSRELQESVKCSSYIRRKVSTG